MCLFFRLDVVNRLVDVQKPLTSTVKVLRFVARKLFLTLCCLVLMAKQLRLLFFGLLVVVVVIFGYINISHLLTNGSVVTRLSNSSRNTVSVYLSLNDKAEDVENSYDQTLKQTRQRVWDLVMARLATINDSSSHRHQSTERSSTTIASSRSSSLLSSSVTPKQHIVSFPHAANAVHQWSSDSVQWLTLTDLPSINVTGADCAALFRDDRIELRWARKFQNAHAKKVVVPTKFIHQASDCTQFVAERHYATRPVNREEAEFPVAFSILMFKDVEQFERLLRAVYRPQNFYCVHVDNKSSGDIQTAVKMIARCFENIFVLQRSFDVRWGTFSVLEPELECMKRLLRRSKKWRYFINLTGQEFPLKTNWQIVRILKAFNGSNNMEGTLKRFVLLNELYTLLPWF